MFKLITQLRSNITISFTVIMIMILNGIFCTEQLYGVNYSGVLIGVNLVATMAWQLCCAIYNYFEKLKKDDQTYPSGDAAFNLQPLLIQ